MKRDLSWTERALRRQLDRRRFLRLATLAAGATLISCSRGDDEDKPTSVPPTATGDIGELVGAVAGYDDPGRWAGRSLVVSTWDGEYRAAQQQAIFEPFARLTGASIEVAHTDTQSLREQVEEGDVQVDVSDVLTEDVLPLANLGLLEELDFSVISTEGLVGALRMEHGIGSSYFSTVLSYLPGTWEDQPPPEGWGDFWNVDAYPGTRGLHREAQTTLEFALLADGVPKDELYPLDVERAFASLERVLPALTLWWEQGAQPAQLMASGDLDMSAAWHSRIERIRFEGSDSDIQWNGGALAGDSWVAPRGGANVDLAMDFINFATRPEVCAAFSSLVPFGPVNVRAFDYLPVELARRLPTFPANLEAQFEINFEWWFTNREAVEARFDEWYEDHP